MRTRFVASTAVVAFALLATAACGGGAPTGDSSSKESAAVSPEASADPATETSAEASGDPAQPAQDVTITYWHAYSADSQEITTLEDIVIPAFEAANPGVKVTQVAVPYDDLHQKLVTAVAGGELPDVVRSDIIWVPELANLGVLEPLDVAMSDFQAIAQAVYPGPLATNLWKDHYYGLPLDTNTLVLLNNPALFEDAGAKPPATMDDYAKLADSFDGTEAALFAAGDLNGWNVLPFIWSFGGDIVSPDVTTATGYINSPQTVQAIQFLLDLYKTGAIPTFITQGGASDPNDGFATGQYATITGGPWMYPIFQGSYPDFNFDATVIPAGDGGSISVVGGEDIVMTASSQNKAAAASFISHMLSEETQRAFAQIGQMPVLSSLAAELTAIQPYYATFTEQLKTAKPRPATPAWTQMDALLVAALQDCFLGDKDVQQTLDSLAAEIDALLAQYQ